MNTPKASSKDGDDSEVVMDLQGLLCPLPVLKARKRLEAMQAGALLTVLADDAMAAIDIPHFCAEQGHELLSHGKQGKTLSFTIRRR